MRTIILLFAFLFLPEAFAQEASSSNEKNDKSAKNDQNDKVDIQKEIEKYFETHPNQNTRVQPPSSPLKLLDISFIALNDFSTSTASLEDFRSLQAGGHDPHNKGFTAANEELSLSGIVDPYFRGDVFIVYSIDDEGESNVELEEAALTTLSLPYGLQFRMGQLFSDFGRLNPTHPHSWGFADQPVVSSRMFGGDGLRGPGAQLSYALPTPFYSELVGGVQNAFGETAYSFYNSEGETFAGRTLGAAKQRSAADMVYMMRLKTAFDLGESLGSQDEITLVAGASAVVGPNSSDFGPNGGGESKRTDIEGLDLYVKWKPVNAEQGFPFVALQSEWMQRNYEAGSDSVAGLAATTLHDWGQYTQLLYGFQRGWVAGFRYDFARGEDGGNDPTRDRRTRLSPNLTFYPSEFSKLRLQYNYDNADFLDEPAHSIIFQFEISFGIHGAHKF